MIVKVKWVLCIVIGFVLLSVPSVYGIENSIELFTNEEKELVFEDLDLDYIATKKDGLDLLYKNSPDILRGDIKKLNETFLTSEELLSILEMSTNRVVKRGNTYYYPYVDNLFLSEEEWMKLVENKDKYISYATLSVLKKRLEESKTELNSLKVLQDLDTFYKIVETYLPEMHPIIDGMENSVDCWLPKEKDGKLITYSCDIENILHELQHEVSARKSHVYDRKVDRDTTKTVYWSGIPNTMYDYNLMDEDWVEIKRVPQIPKTVTIKDKIPTEIHDDILYKTYVIKEDSLSSMIGVYGMLQEFSSYVIDLRTEYVFSNIEYNQKSVFNSTVKNIYFWESLILTYLSEVEKSSPKYYNKVISDKDFIDLMYDLMVYSRVQLQYANITYQSIELQNMKNWFYSKDVQLQRMKLFSHKFSMADN